MDDLYFKDFWSLKTKEDVKKLPGPILIVGASGFIGSRLFHSLVQLRQDVYGISKNILTSWRMTHLPKDIIQNHLFNVDITNLDQTKIFLEKIKAKTIFNLSAYGAYERQSDVAEIHNVNYMGLVNLLQVSSKMDLFAFVQAGSSSEYGINCTAPAEKSELIPNSHYAVSKVACSYLINFYGLFHNVPTVNLRLYSIYGPFEERDRLVPKLVSFGIEKKYPPLADPDISRDFLFVDDCTTALVRAALTVCRNSPGLSLNICTSKRTTLREIATQVKDIFQIPEEPQFKSMKNRGWDLSNWYGNGSKAYELLDWTPATSLQEGLIYTRDWELGNLDKLSVGAVPTRSKKISAVIACYKDHQAIPFMHQRLTETFVKAGYDYEIIFVNDCSPTEDESVIEKLSTLDYHVIGISHSRNFGSQSAFLSGLEISTGDAAILLDGDLQDPPEVIPQFIEQWEAGYDVVYGIRIKREARVYMQVLYKVFYRIFRKLADVNIPLDAGDFSLLDRKVIHQLVSLNEKDVFLRGLRAWVGFKQTGVPYQRPERMFGVTTNSFLKNIWWAKKAIFSFSTKPLNYIQGTSVFIFISSLLLSTFYVIHYFFFETVHEGKGTTSIILLTLILGGLQILAISILGDYIGKILEEVKSRPKFIRSRIIRAGQTYDSKVKGQSRGKHN